MTCTVVSVWVIAVVGVGMVGAAAYAAGVDHALGAAFVWGILGVPWFCGAVLVMRRMAWALRWDASGVSGRMCWPFRTFAYSWDEFQAVKVQCGGLGAKVAPMIVLTTDSGGRILVSDYRRIQLPSELRELGRTLASKQVPVVDRFDRLALKSG